MPEPAVVVTGVAGCLPDVRRCMIKESSRSKMLNPIILIPAAIPMSMQSSRII